MAHTFGTSTNVGATTANPINAAFTTNTGDTVLWLSLGSNSLSARTGGSPTFNGTAMTQVPAGLITSAETSTEQWYLLAPAIGAFTLSIPNTGAKRLTPVIATARAGGGTSVYGTYNSATNAGATDPTVTITTTATASFIFSSISSGADTWSPSAQTGTNLYNVDDGLWGYGAQYFIQTGAGAKAMGYTFGTSDDYSTIVVSFNEPESITMTPTVINIVSAVVSPTIVGTANVTTSVINITSAVQAPNVVPGKWGNADKSSSTWTNLDKS